MSRPPINLPSKATNLKLPEKLCAECKTLAAGRYGVSLSELVARLLVKEARNRNGLVHVRPRELSPLAAKSK